MTIQERCKACGLPIVILSTDRRLCDECRAKYLKKNLSPVPVLVPVRVFPEERQSAKEEALRA